MCSGQLKPTWRGAVAGGVLIYTHIGGCGFESRCARAIFLAAFGALGVVVIKFPQRTFSRNYSRQPVGLHLMRLFPREYWLRNVAALACCFAPQGHFSGLETGTYGHANARTGALEAQIGAQNPQLVGFPSTHTALDPGLVRLGRLGAVMATRVQNVQMAEKMIIFACPPSVVRFSTCSPNSSLRN